ALLAERDGPHLGGDEPLTCVVHLRHRTTRLGAPGLSTASMPLLRRRPAPNRRVAVVLKPRDPGLVGLGVTARLDPLCPPRLQPLFGNTAGPHRAVDAQRLVLASVR